MAVSIRVFILFKVTHISEGQRLKSGTESPAAPAGDEGSEQALYRCQLSPVIQRQTLIKLQVSAQICSSVHVCSFALPLLFPV